MAHFAIVLLKNPQNSVGNYLGRDFNSPPPSGLTGNEDAKGEKQVEPTSECGFRVYGLRCFSL